MNEWLRRSQKILKKAAISINPMKKTAKIYLGITILICVSIYNVCLISLGSPIKRIIKSEGLFSLMGGNDKVSIFEKKLSKLKPFLSGYGTIGYIDNRGSIATSEELMEYIIAQYALSPILVKYGTDYKFVLANYVNFNIDNNFIIINKIDDNLILYKKVVK